MKQKHTPLWKALPVVILCACGGNRGNDAAVQTGDAVVSAAGAGQQIPDSIKVPLAEAKKLVANYAPKAGFVKEKSDSLPDSRAIWFSIERMEALVKQIRAEKGDGIRFYFATYNKDYPKGAKGNHIPPKDYWGYNTLVMVSTRDSLSDGRAYHQDYYTNRSPGQSESKGFVVTAEIQNMGEMCPPPCNCQLIGAMLVSKPDPEKPCK